MDDSHSSCLHTDPDPDPEPAAVARMYGVTGRGEWNNSQS